MIDGETAAPSDYTEDYYVTDMYLHIHSMDIADMIAATTTQPTNPPANGQPSSLLVFDILIYSVEVCLPCFSQ